MITFDTMLFGSFSVEIGSIRRICSVDLPEHWRSDGMDGCLKVSNFSICEVFFCGARNSVGSANPRREPAFSLSSFLVSTTTVAMGSICGAGDGDSTPQPARILGYNTSVFVCARVDFWSGGKRRCIGREKTRRKVVRIGGISRVSGPVWYTKGAIATADSSLKA